MPFVETLSDAVKPWSELYSHSKVVSVAVTFAHLGALLVGGGIAVAADRSTLRVAAGDADAERRHLLDLAGTHRVVIGALVVTVLSGVLLFASDVETFAVSLVYWSKMALVLALLGNGLLMQRAERGARWGALRRSAVISLALWLLITLLGVVLVEAA
ncbi:MAG: hypothetical protein JWO05_97 [Gemmatimonadetes bacterium]|nr:hypothetical protein [Gemmatimonadota bacterium]